MGCCQDKISQTSDETANESVEGGGQDADGRGGAQDDDGGQVGREDPVELSGLVNPVGTEVTVTDATDTQSYRKRKSNDSLLITVLWRRLSLFSRRDSSRSTKRPSAQSQKVGGTFPDAHSEILEESEKG